jgi:hypothetical protein
LPNSVAKDYDLFREFWKDKPQIVRESILFVQTLPVPQRISMPQRRPSSAKELVRDVAAKCLDCDVSKFIFGAAEPRFRRWNSAVSEGCCEKEGRCPQGICRRTSGIRSELRPDGGQVAGSRFQSPYGQEFGDFSR